MGLWKKTTKICQKLKNKKSRDQNGFIYELLKPDNCGSVVQMSLMKMCNAMKNPTEVPEFMRNMMITSIFTQKGSKYELTSLTCPKFVVFWTKLFLMTFIK